MIAPTPFFSHRGTHIRILEEARALEKRGHSVKILTYHVGDDIHKYISTNIDVRRVRRWLFWYKKTSAGADWQKIILNLFLIRKILWMTYVWRPDILHGHIHEGVIMGWIARRLFFWRDMRLVADFHGSLVGEMRSHGYLGIGIVATFFSFLERTINTMGDAAIVSSADHIQTIKSARKDRRVYHIYDGVDMENYRSLIAQRNVLRKKYNVPIKKTIVVFTGGLVRNKGIHHFLESAHEILGKRQDLFFVVGGDHAQWIEQYVKEKRIAEHFLIIYPLNYFIMPEINVMANITVDPKSSHSHQASGKILQYMAANTATVCVDRETNRRYLGDAGTYIPAVDKDRLAQVIMKLADDPENCRIKGLLAIKRVTTFSWYIVGERLEGVYLSV